MTLLAMQAGRPVVSLLFDGEMDSSVAFDSLVWQARVEWVPVWLAGVD